MLQWTSGARNKSAVCVRHQRRPRTLHMGDDDTRFCWRRLHGLSPEAASSRVTDGIIIQVSDTKGRLRAAFFVYWKQALRQELFRSHLNSKIVHPFARPELRGKPTWLVATPGPRFQRVIRITKFWRDGRIPPTV